MINFTIIDNSLAYISIFTITISIITNSVRMCLATPLLLDQHQRLSTTVRGLLEAK